MSMPVNIVLPDLQAGPATLSVWFAQPGEDVFEGDRLVEVMIQGATFDVVAPVSGKLIQQRVLPRDQVVPGQVLGLLVSNDEESPDRGQGES